ncbi:MAG TPA: SDR family NAD(P)-dependent oxidoreductase [Mycobacteriales bacterium]|nr:SDR family NAD(P)-dependent oxidoreductase [Mycobacteriales bacterium]
MSTPPPSRVVLVVGGSSGIGRAVGHLLSERGDHVVLAARGRRSLDLAVAECRDRGAASVRGEVVDVRDDSAVQRLVDGVLREHGRVDAVVTTAAVLAFGRFEDVPADVFEEVVRTNVVGVANVARAALPVLRSSGGGTLVLLGSVLGETAAPSMTPYVVSKWAVRSLARQLAIETRDDPDVRVCLVAPGAVNTPIYRRAGNYQGRAPKAPFPVISPERVARVVAQAVDRPRSVLHTTPFDHVMRAGFALLPWAYDAMVGPLYRLLGTTRVLVAATPGNVFGAVEELEGLHGTTPPPLMTTSAGR